MIPRWTVTLLLLTAGPAACVPASAIVQDEHVHQDYAQTVTVHTDPPGATVWRRVEGDAIELGVAPVAIQGEYGVISLRTDKAACALAGMDAGLAVGEEVGGKAGAVIGLVGMVAGAAAASKACKEADGPVETQGGEVVLVATMPGYLSERHVIHFPRALSQVTIRLIPDPNAPIANAPAPAEAQPTRTADPSTGRRPAHARIGGPAGEPIRRPGLAIYPVAVEVRGDEAAPDLADGLTGELVAACDRVGLPGPDPEAGPDLVLETRLLAVGGLCVLSASLHRAGERETRRVESERSTCDRSAVDAAIGRLAVKLAPNREEGGHP